MKGSEAELNKKPSKEVSFQKEASFEDTEPKDGAVVTESYSQIILRALIIARNVSLIT